MRFTLLTRSVFTLSIIFSLHSFAAINDMSLGLGFISRAPGDIQTSAQGEKNSVSDFRPFLTTSLNWQFYKKNGNYLSLAPEFTFEKPGNTRDENISKINYWTTIPIVYSFDYTMFGSEHNFSTRFGPGFSWTRISGDGGTKSLPNGAGTSNFPVPEGASYTQNITLTLGLGYTLKRKYSLYLDAQRFNAFDSEKSSMNYLLSFHYHFQDKLWKK